MASLRLGKISVAALVLSLLAAVPAMGALSATATIFGVPNGAAYDYTVSVKDTGTTDIGTFWFAWTPPGAPIEYDFLPHAPSSANQPAGWVGLISGGFPGTSIEYYNVSGSPISPGQTATFQFTTTDSPATLQGSVFGFPMTTSFIYEGAPEVGSFSRVDPAFVPEPSCRGVIGLGGAALRTRRRRHRS